MVSLDELPKRIKDGTVKIGIIGLGYVGLPLAMAMSRRFDVMGYDRSSELIERLGGGKSPYTDVPDSVLADRLENNFSLTNNEKDLQDCDFHIICVPTPLDNERKPDLSYIRSACEAILSILREGHFVILESTSYPGTTEEIVIPNLEKSGFKAGVDFGVAYSPERVDPGNKKYTVENISKVVGGVNELCTEIAANLYESSLNTEVHKAKNPRTAEATKIVENVFRDVNIALANELAMIFERMDIDMWEVIKLASTKPFGFMPFYPGPGVGGHCIPLDPLYLSYQAKKFDFIPRFIELSGEINDFMPVHTANLLRWGLKQKGKKIAQSTVTIMGIAYKGDVRDTRESPAKEIIEQIVGAGGNVKIYDPLAKMIDTKHGTFESLKSPEDAVEGSDAMIIVTNHSAFSEEFLSSLIRSMEKPVIVDCKNILKNGLGSISENGIYLGIGKPFGSE